MEDLRKAKLDLPPPPAPNEFPQKPFGVFVEPNFEAKVGIRKSIFSVTEKEVTDTVILRREMTAQELQDIAESAPGATQTAHSSNGQLNSAAGESVCGWIFGRFSVCRRDCDLGFLFYILGARFPLALSLSLCLVRWNMLHTYLHILQSIIRTLNYKTKQNTPIQIHPGMVPDSEDGGSLLGSSRKSLADTSVTSTADLSVFSTGPRSQQAFDVCVDDSRSIRTDPDADAEHAGDEAGADDDDADENGELSPGYENGS